MLKPLQTPSIIDVRDGEREKRARARAREGGWYRVLTLSDTHADRIQFVGTRRIPTEGHRRPRPFSALPLSTPSLSPVSTLILFRFSPPLHPFNVSIPSPRRLFHPSYSRFPMGKEGGGGEDSARLSAIKRPRADGRRVIERENLQRQPPK